MRLAAYFLPLVLGLGAFWSCKSRDAGTPEGSTLLGEEPARAQTGAGFTRIALSQDDIEALWQTVSSLEPQESKTLAVSVGSATCANHGLGEGVRVLCSFELKNAGPKMPMSDAAVHAFCEKLYGRKLDLEGNAIFKVSSECWLAGTVDHVDFIADRYDLLEHEEKLGAFRGRGSWVVAVDLLERRAVRSWALNAIQEADFDGLKASAEIYYPETYFRDKTWTWEKAKPLTKQLDATEFRTWFKGQFVSRDIRGAEEASRKERDAKADAVVSHLTPFLFTGPGSTVTVVPLSNPKDENMEFSFAYVIGDKTVVAVVSQFEI